ncbi:MAG: hypothetical protein HUU38_28330 [Anaerolineales bacterium]|nr:hypothetical protein [Anaerolineales bacterium]
MLETLFPSTPTTYKGQTLAKWMFILLTAVTLFRSLEHIFAPDGGAQTIATIPLDTYPANAAAAVILIFSLWGLSQLLIGLIYLVVLWRYPGFIPFMYLLMIVEYGMRIYLGAIKPIETTGTAPGGVGNYILLPLAAGMLVLSLWPPRPKKN